MNSPTPLTCSQCGGVLGSGTTGGVCPRCEFASILEPIAAPNPAVAPAEVRRFGDYELLEEIAHGGMGVVYRARHERLNRVVALKMLLLGPFASDLAVKRFQREAAAAASFRHPGIVSVFEVGEVEGQHFFTMELVEGRSLASLLQGGPLPARAAAVYLKGLADAMAHAHAQGIVHRDLKPSNILIDLFDVPRITDFGLARRLDGSGDLTLTGHIVGSPNYLAPELLTGRLTSNSEATVGPTAAGDIPPNSVNPGSATLADLFSLGAVLYEAITGRPPFLGATIEETLLRVRDSEPMAPRALQPRVPRDLETICLKCLEKDPARRYAGARELAEELGRFLDGHPILARPLSPAGKAWRWAQRKPTLAGLIVALHLVGVLGLSGVLWQWKRAEEEAGRANRSSREAQNNLVRQWVATGNQMSGRGRVLEALPWYLAALQNEPDPEHRDTHRRRLTATLRASPRSEHVWFHSNRVNTVTLSPNDRWVASGSDDTFARVWDMESGEPLTPPLPHGESVRGATFRQDGARLLTYSSQKLHHPGLGAEAGQGSVRLWSLPEGRELWSFIHSNTVHAAEFSPDGSRILSACTDGRVRVWMVHEALGRTRVTLEHEFIHPDEARSAVFSPDGQRIATGCRDGRFRLWDRVTGRLLSDLESAPSSESRRAWDRRWKVVFSPDGRQLAGYRDFAVRVWETDTGRRLFDLSLDNEVNSLAFQPHGRFLVTSSRGGLAEIWSTTNSVRRSILRTVPFFTSVDETARATFTPLGDRVMLWNRNGLTFYYPQEAQEAAPFLPVKNVREAQLTRDGRRVVVGDEMGRVSVWNLVPSWTTDRTLELSAVGNAVRFSPDGRRLVAGDLASTVGLWDPRTGRSLLEVPHRQSSGNWGVDQLVTSPDGKNVLAADHGGTFGLYAFENGAPVTPLRTNSPGHRVHAAFLPDGRHIVTGDYDGVLRVVRLADGTVLRSLTNHLHLPFADVLITRDGRWLVTLANDRTAQRRDPMTLEPQADPMPVGGPPYMGQISPDQRLLLTTCSSEGQPRVWELATGRLLTTLDYPTGPQSGGFSPDGRWIVVCGFQGGIRLWDAATGQLVHDLSSDGIMHVFAFSPDSRWLATSGDQGARVWDLSTGQAVTPILGNSIDLGFSNALDWSPDSQSLAGVGGRGRARIWDLRAAPWSDADWETVVVALTGNRLDDEGRLVTVSTEAFTKARHDARRRFPEEFTPTAEQSADFLWLDGQFGSDPGIARELRRYLDLAEASDPPDSPELGRSEIRHRRAILRLRTGDLTGASEDKPALGDLRRDPACTAHQINLEGFINRGLGIWGFGEPGVHLGDLAPGIKAWGGVRFDVRGIMATDGDNSSRGQSPERIQGIPVGVQGAALHLIQGANFENSDGEPIGDLVLHYVDGEERRLPVVYGRDTRNWWTVAGESTETPNARVVWTGECPGARAERQSLRLFMTSFPNPRPDVEVRSLDLVSAMNRAGFFVVAITLE